MVSSNPAELDMVTRQLPADRLEAIPFNDPQAALDYLGKNPVDVFVADEEHDDVSGLELLIDAHQMDQYTSLVLIVDEDHGIDLASDAINRARVSKIVLRPFDIEELIEELIDAARRYDRDVRKDRHLNLSKVKVTRLTRAVEQSRRDLAQKTRQLDQLKRMPVVLPSAPHSPAPASTAPEPEEQPSGPILDEALQEKIANLLVDLAQANSADASCQRVRALTEFCVDALDWPDDETYFIEIAASLHHALITRFPGERQIEVRGGSKLHATNLALALEGIPGFEEVARIVAHHHSPVVDEFGRPVHAPRGARLLQILSLFDEISHDPQLLNSAEAEIDAQLGLSRASDVLLNLAQRARVDMELCQRCVKDLIPRFMRRAERCHAIEQLTEGMVLSRTVYADNLALVRAGAKLSPAALDKIRYADESIHFPGIWIAQSEDHEDWEQEN